MNVGFGIDYTMRAPASVAPVGISAANAVDLLTRPSAQALPARPAPRVLVPNLTNGLRGLHATASIDSAGLVQPRSSDDWVTKRPSKGPMPYVRFSEEERVLGLSFKIQPPPQVPEVASPGL